MKNSLFIGPGNWLPLEFLHSLKSFGFPVELRDLLVSFDASKVRVAQHTSLSLGDLCTDLVLSMNAFKLGANESHEHWV